MTFGPTTRQPAERREPPAVGDRVLILVGRYRGARGELVAIDEVPTPTGRTALIARVRRPRAGDTFAFLSDVVRVETPSVRYDVAHKQVRQQLDMTRCVECGQVGPTQAALIHGHGRFVDAGRLYSDDPADYRPLCRPCHLRYDDVIGEYNRSR